MKTNLITKKSNFAIVAVLAITSLIMIAAGPAPAFGPIRVAAISSSVSNDQLSAMFHHDRDLSATLKGDIKQTQDLQKSFRNLLHVADKSVQITNRDMVLYQYDLSRAERLETDLMTKLAAHPGIDTNGDIANSATARATLETLDLYLSNAQYWVRQASDAFTRAQESRIK